VERTVSCPETVSDFSAMAFISAVIALDI